MTAAVHLCACAAQNQSSKVRSFDGDLQEEFLPFSDSPPYLPSAGPLLDRKVGGASVAGLYLRRHSVSTPIPRCGLSQLSCGIHADPAVPTVPGNGKELHFRERSYSENGERLRPGVVGPGQVNSSRYKTELCRPFQENGACKYGDKCQFAHGLQELRSLSRHPKYKTEPCRTFHTIGFCPYGPRCHFIHNAEERRGPSGSERTERPRLQHSCSFAGFPSSPACHTSEDDPTGWHGNPFAFSGQDLGDLFLRSFAAPLGLELPPPASPTVPSFLRASESLPSPVDSLSDQEEYRSSPGSLSGSESPGLDPNRRLPIFSRLSISED